MKPVVVSQSCSAPAETLWQVVTDLASWSRYVTAIEGVELVSEPGPFAVGTRWRETRRMFGQSATEEMWVSALDAGHSYTVESDSRGVRYTSVVTVSAQGSGSQLSQSFAAEPQSSSARFFASVTGPLMRRSVAKALQADAADLVEAAASRSAAS